MRLAFPCAIGTALVLAVSALASPQFSSTFELTYSASTVKSPSGLLASASWTDPAAENAVPKGVTRIVLTFHPGTRFDTSALPRCTASDEDIANQAVRACPRAAKLGSVKGQGLIKTGNPFNTEATLFNARRQIIVIVTLAGTKRLITYFRDDVGRSSISINLKIPGGLSLTKFDAKVPRHFKKRHRKRRAYMTTPPTCPPSGVWTTGVTFFYRDGSTEQRSSTTPCRGQRAP